MDRRAAALVLASPLALAWAGGCTSRQLPSDDEIGEGTSAAETTQAETTQAETTQAETTQAETTQAETSDDTTSEDTTTGFDCGDGKVVGNLTIQLDTPPEDYACVREVYTRLRIKDVDWVDLSPMPLLEQVGRLEFYQVNSMQNLSGAALVEVTHLSLNAMDSLSSTAGLEQLSGLESLYLAGLPMLATVELPVGLPSVSIDVYDSSLDLLVDLQPEPSGPAFYVSVGSGTQNIAGLMSCCDFPQLDLSTYSQVLTDFTGLQGITSMSGLHVSNAGQLVNLAGLEQLESIGTLEILGSKCDAQEGWLEQAIHITGIAELESLAAVDQLRLNYLFDLVALDGLPPGATVNSLEIRNDTALSYAQADAFASAVQAQAPTICGLQGDFFCYLNRSEAAPCPQ